MPFSEHQKRKVKEMASFRCCRCQIIGVEVHHIIPEADGGPDNIDNAAPLCPSCHSYFGDNHRKRKEITRMRDWWYEQVEKKYSGPTVEMLEDINSKLENIDAQTSALPDLKNILKTLANQTIDTMTPDTAVVAASGIVNASSTAQISDGAHTNVICGNCNEIIGSQVGSNQCPKWGSRLG